MITITVAASVVIFPWRADKRPPRGNWRATGADAGAIAAAAADDDVGPSVVVPRCGMSAVHAPAGAVTIATVAAVAGVIGIAVGTVVAVRFSARVPSIAGGRSSSSSGGGGEEAVVAVATVVVVPVATPRGGAVKLELVLPRRVPCGRGGEV